MLVANDIGLVYGGASVGVMGAVADTVLEEGGEVTGIIPEDLMSREVAHHGLTKLHVVESMHDRKALMADLADGFVALPGGMGTLEELFEILTWAQLGYHRKPCGLLNLSGYYDRLREFLDHTVAEGFVQDKHRSMLIVEQQPEQLIERFKTYQPPVVKKWIDKDST